MPYVSNAMYGHFKTNAPSVKVKVVIIVLKIDKDYLVEQKYYFTEEEFNTFRLKDRYTIHTDTEEESLNIIMDGKFHPMCVKCFNEYMTKIGHADLL